MEHHGGFTKQRRLSRMVDLYFVRLFQVFRSPACAHWRQLKRFFGDEHLIFKLHPCVAPLYVRYIMQLLTQYLLFERHKKLQKRDIVFKWTRMRTYGNNVQ